MKNSALFGKMIWLITGMASLCVGLGALGINMERLLRLSSMSYLIRCGVGAAGAISLILLVTTCCSGCTSSKC